jgi:hypothetical protein
MAEKGVLIRVLRFDHPHIESLFQEGLWGFPDNKKNRNKWETIERGDLALLYGEYKGRYGIWQRGEIIDKFENKKPVKYWTQDPTGFPLQVKINLHPPSLSVAEPIDKHDLISIYQLTILKMRYGWSLQTYSEPEDFEIFKKIYDEYEAKNLVRVDIDKPTELTHDEIKEITYQIGVVQGQYPQKEFVMNDGRRLDVIWRKTATSVPSWAFEVQVGGNPTEALSKVKHAWDMYNSIPVIITTEDQLNEVQKLLSGTFHEIQDEIRIIPWERMKELYDVKIKLRDLKNKLRLI